MIKTGVDGAMGDTEGFAVNNDKGEEKSGAGRCEVSETEKSDVELLDAYSRAIMKVAETVGPAVVGITVGGRSIPGQVGAGSGVLIAPDGYILTNDHVVHSAEEILVTLTSGAALKAELIGADPATDLAVIRAEDSGLPYATFGDSAALRVGQLVIA